MLLDNPLALEDDERSEQTSGPTSANGQESEAKIDNQGTIPLRIWDKHRRSLLTCFQTTPWH